MKNNTTISIDGDVRRTVLDNGIRIVTERMPFVRSVALGVWVQAGSGNESPENNGIAHFLEHRLFKGTTTRTAKEIAQSLESLGGGMGSRLFQNIREKYGFACSVFSFSELMSTIGVFGAYIACEKKKIKESIRLLRLEVEKIKDGDVSASELEQAKSQLKGNLIMGLESSSRRMKKIGEAEIYGGAHYSIDEIMERVFNVRKQDVEKLVHELFTITNTSITILSP